MTRTIIIFFNLLLAAMLAGTMFGIWIGYNPIDLSASGYVEQQQNMIRQLKVLMPLLGYLTIVLTLISAFLQKQSKIVFISLLIAVTLMVVSGLITRFGNQPINDIVMTWSINSPPDNWIELRDKWSTLHMIRTNFVLFALSIIIITGIRSNKIVTTTTKRH
ncbi:MAG: DUF1772 domain-containing protein [Chitinophagaceae bacterium]